MDTTWTRDDHNSRFEVFVRGEYGDDQQGYVAQYEGSNRYNWQAIRGEFRLSGIVEGAAAAMEMCDVTLALPVEEFNARVAADLIAEMRVKEAQIQLLMPNTTILPGYEAGVMAGYEKARAAVMNTLESL